MPPEPRAVPSAAPPPARPALTTVLYALTAAVLLATLVLVVALVGQSGAGAGEPALAYDLARPGDPPWALEAAVRMAQLRTGDPDGAGRWERAVTAAQAPRTPGPGGPLPAGTGTGATAPRLAQALPGEQRVRPKDGPRSASPGEADPPLFLPPPLQPGEPPARIPKSDRGIELWNQMVENDQEFYRVFNDKDMLLGEQLEKLEKLSREFSELSRLVEEERKRLGLEDPPAPGEEQDTPDAPSPVPHLKLPSKPWELRDDRPVPPFEVPRLPTKLPWERDGANPDALRQPAEEQLASTAVAGSDGQEGRAGVDAAAGPPALAFTGGGTPLEVAGFEPEPLPTEVGGRDVDDTEMADVQLMPARAAEGMEVADAPEISGDGGLGGSWFGA